VSYILRRILVPWTIPVPLFIAETLSPSASSTAYQSIARICTQVSVLSEEEQLQKLKDEQDEVDVNLETYKKQRLLARRSPYPTVCVESRATPPPDFSQAPPPPSMIRRERMRGADDESGEEKVTLDDVQRLEALFGKAAVIKEGDKCRRCVLGRDWQNKGNSRTHCCFSPTPSSNLGQRES
jgi:hypothetical protein